MVVIDRLDNQVCAETLAWLSSDHGGHFEVGLGPENDSAGSPITGAGHEQAKIGALSVNQSIAINNHVIEQADRG